MKVTPLIPHGAALRLQSLRRVVNAAPPAPPCFESQEAWQQYLGWCAASEEPGFAPTVSGTEEPGEAGALRADKRRRLFNAELAFCRDCQPEYRRQMERCGRCRPEWLRAQEYQREHQQEAACA